jgi:hypothetical protein
MSSTLIGDTKEIRGCAGKNCQRYATIILKLKFIKKKGSFCDICASELLRLELASIDNVTPIMKYSETKYCGRKI